MTLNGETLENSRRRAPPAVFHKNANDVLETLIFCCACKPDDAIGADKRPRNYAHPCCSVTAALCDDVDLERQRLNATGPARDLKTRAKSKVQKALWQINDPDAPLHLPLRAPHHKNAFVAAAEAMASSTASPNGRSSLPLSIPSTSSSAASACVQLQCAPFLEIR